MRPGLSAAHSKEPQILPDSAACSLVEKRPTLRTTESVPCSYEHCSTPVTRTSGLSAAPGSAPCGETAGILPTWCFPPIGPSPTSWDIQAEVLVMHSADGVRLSAQRAEAGSRIPARKECSPPQHCSEPHEHSAVTTEITADAAAVPVLPRLSPWPGHSTQYVADHCPKRFL